LQKEDQMFQAIQLWAFKGNS